jgi:hypothetical protein
MFKENTKHLQTNLFGLNSLMSDKMRDKIKQSEEYYFYNLIFCKIDEHIFSVLFSDQKSRPNAPINALVSAIILMNKRGWTFEELFKQVQFNLLIKVALGLNSIEEMPFSPATMFNFQNRINEHFIKTGENLLEQVFDQLTAEQLNKLKLKTNIQRTDSFAAASNIRNYSRLQLLIELIIRLYRVLSDKDKERFKSHFENYTQKSSGQYIYNLTSVQFPKELEKIGQLYHWIEQNVKPFYKEHDIFRTFERVYAEHFSLIDHKIQVKSNDELSSDCLQSPDDLDAAYRKKNSISSKGQSVNIVETAHPDNPINLITDIDVNPVNKDDSVVLNQRLDKLKEKTPDIDELHFDGAYGSAENDLKFEAYNITPVQTAIKGPKSAVDIKIEKESEQSYKVSCPYQSVEALRARKRYKAEFKLEICNHCPLKKNCPARVMKKSRVFYFGHNDYLCAKRQKVIKNIPAERRTLRNNVEATVNEFTCRLPKKKLKVRGAFKTYVFALTMAASINFGRIYRYLAVNPGLFSQILFIYATNFKERLLYCFSLERFYINQMIESKIDQTHQFRMQKRAA